MILAEGQIKTLKDELESQRSQLDELERNIAILSAVLLESLTRWERLRSGKEPDSELAGLEKRNVTLERNQKKAKQ